MITRLLAQIDTSPLPKVGVKGEGGVYVPTDSPIQTVLQIFFGVIGATAVLIITIAAFQFVISRGEPQAVNKARNTIIYAAVGLGVAIMGYSIVTFVIGRL